MKPENRFYNSVHVHLPPPSKLHREKMANPYNSGTADSWYSGRGTGSTDLWVEWKFIKVPVRDDTIISLVAGKKPMLSALQQEWLNSRIDEGRNVWVGVGSEKGGLFLRHKEWMTAITAKEFRRRMLTRKDMAVEIATYVQGTS